MFLAEVRKRHQMVQSDSAYIKIDMATQNTELVKLEKGINIYDKRRFNKKYLSSFEI